MADRLRDQQQFELFKNKHIGIGNADTLQKEWITNIKRDTYSSMASHAAFAEYYSVATNEPVQLTKVKFIENMIQPYQKQNSKK